MKNRCVNFDWALIGRYLFLRGLELHENFIDKLLKSMSLLFNKKNDALQSLSRLEQTEMLTKLIAQLNKDLSLSGIETQFNLNWSPAMLIDHLNEIVSTLMKNDFQKFTNLLYRIDVSEKKIRDIGTSDLEVMVSKLTLMILQKEWQKVWFRNRNSLQE